MKIQIRISASADRSKILVTFPYSEERVAVVKDVLNPVPVFRMEGQVKRFDHWEIPINEDGENKIRSVLNDDRFNVDHSALFLFDVAREWKDENYRLANLYDSNEIMQIPGMADLTPWQTIAAQYAIRNARGVILNDNENMDRVLSSIGAVLKMEATPCLIVCSSDNKLKWFTALKNIIPGKSIQYLSKGQPIKELTEFTIINYDLLVEHIESLLELHFNSVIFSDSEKLKSRKSLWFQASEKITGQVNKKIMLSSMYLIQHPEYLLSVVSVAGRLNDFGSPSNFLKLSGSERRDDGYGWMYRVGDPEPGFKKELESICYIGRKKPI